MSVLDIVRTIQQSVPIPKWKVSSGNIGTGVFVSSTVCTEWSLREFEKTATWCVFGTGEGYIYFELAKHLVDAGHSPELIFTSGMLVGFDCNKDSVNIIKDKVSNLYNIERDLITVYNRDYFKLEKSMKFDNFIINPPYLDGSAGNIPVTHEHTEIVHKHWNKKGKGVVITKSSPALSNERYGDVVRNFVTSTTYNGYKARFLPDDAFPNAIVRSWYLVFDGSVQKNTVEVYGKDGLLEYVFDKHNDIYIFPTKKVRDIVKLLGTDKNTESLYPIKRVDSLQRIDKKVDCVILIDSGKKTLEKTSEVHKDFGKVGFGMRFQVGGDTNDVFRSHTHHSCLVLNNETIKKDYAICASEKYSIDEQLLDATCSLYQIRHPLNAWIHAFTRTSEQSSRSPQFKFCCKISMDEFYKLWPNGNPSIKEYFDYWKISPEHQNDITTWYSKYV